MTIRETSVAIDEDLLATVKQILDTETVKDTIEKAFLEVLRTQARREEVAALARMEGSQLADHEVMSRAWRR